MPAHRTLHDLHKANFRVNDPGNGGTIDVGSRNFTVCELVTAGASETRTVPQPLRSGQRLTLAVKTDGGDVTLTFTGGFNQAGTTTTQLAEVNDYISVESVASGTSYVWRVLSSEGASGQTFVLGDAAITEAELEVLDGVTAGDVTNSKALVAGATDDAVAVLDFSSVTVAAGANVIRGVGLDLEDVTGYLCFEGNTTTGFRYSSYWQQSTDGDAKILGLGVFPQIISGGASDRMQSLSTVMSVESGGTLEDRNGDATAGAHCVWAKFGMDLSNATFESGARVAPIWSDIQVNNGDISGEESYHFFASAGGSRARAMLRIEGHSVYFLESDSTLDDRMAVSTGYADTQSATPSGYLKVNLNGTIYGIPLMAAT